MADNAGNAGNPRVDRGYVGVPTFLRSQLCLDADKLDADVAVIGIPIDQGSPFMPGSRFGPRSLREHSLRFSGTEGYYDLDKDRQFLRKELQNRRIVDVGDVDVLPANVEGTFDNITRDIGRILEKGAMPLTLGGDHAITYPVVRAFEGYGPLNILQFDAHLDYSPFENGLTYTNGHAFRHIRSLGFIEDMFQVGIRSMRTTKRDLTEAREAGNHVISMAEFRRMGLEKFVAMLPEGGRFYVSIDIDAFDMSLVPGCVSAEPDGFLSAELRETLAAVAERTNVVGFDLVEVNPQLDVGTGVTSYLGAQTIIAFLGAIFDKQ